MQTGWHTASSDIAGWPTKADGGSGGKAPETRPHRGKPRRARPPHSGAERRSRLLRCAGGVLAAILAAAVLRTPQSRQAAALVAAGLRQPENAARLLAERLEQPLHTALPAAAEPAQQGGEPLTEETATAPSESSAAPESTVSAPPEDGSGGKIEERKLSAGDTLLHGIGVKNRSGAAVDIATALSDPLPRKWQKTADPQVLIVHTHTTEGYMRYDAGYYNAGDRERTTDGSRTVCAVGDAVVKTLAAGGITAIHDTTVHDSPQYSGAYTRSAATVEKNLQQYPSIQIVLDLHRDAITDGSTLVKPTVTVNGRKAAQMMLVAGVVSTKALPNPNCRQNLALAAQWQRALTAVDPDLMRPLSTVASRYNQNLCPGYLLVEVGAEGNTVAEAAYSGELLAKTLLELLQ